MDCGVGGILGYGDSDDITSVFLLSFAVFAPGIDRSLKLSTI